MSTSSTKYPNNQRIVSGVVNVGIDDSVLLCDTTSAPVTINLMSIPSAQSTYASQGNWSTQYKLYIVDYAQNSSTNNIVVVAPTGFKINAAQTATLNNNGGSMCVRIVSNIDYLGSGALSAVAGANIPYVIGLKSFYVKNNFVPINANDSVTQGLVMTAYDSQNQAGLLTGTLNLTTGIFTVPATGIYNLNSVIGCQINLNPNTPQDLSGNYWTNLGTTPDGIYVTLAICKIKDGALTVLTSNKQHISTATSDIYISCSAMNTQLTKNDTYCAVVLNKTAHNIVGVNYANNGVVFSIHKIA